MVVEDEKVPPWYDPADGARMARLSNSSIASAGDRAVRVVGAHHPPPAHDIANSMPTFMRMIEAE